LHNLFGNCGIIETAVSFFARGVDIFAGIGEGNGVKACGNVLNGVEYESNYVNILSTFHGTQMIEILRRIW